MSNLLYKIKKVLGRVKESRKSYSVGKHTRYSSYPSNGLTPERLAGILREADQGEVLRQMELFEEMEEKDPHLFSQLQTRKNAVTGLDYEIISYSEDEQDKKIAEFVRNHIAQIEDFEDALTDLMDAIGKGIAFIELAWDFTSEGFGIKKLKSIHQKNFFWDEEDEIKIRTEENPAGEYLQENKFIIHQYKAKSGHPSRAGVLRVCAWMYLFKNYDVKDWVSFCEVYGMPVRIGKYKPDASEEEKSALMRALVNIGIDAAGIIPDGSEIEIIESSKQSSVDLFEKLARFCDEQMSKAILGQTLTSDSGSGSYAQSKTHNEVRHDLTIADCKALAATLRRDLLTPLVKLNFGEKAHVPYIRFDCDESEDLEKLVDVYDKLINKIGLDISKDHIYKKFNIPRPEAGEEVAKGETPKQSTGLIANKLTFEGQQGEVDDLVTISKLEGADYFKQAFKPLKVLLDESKSLEELKAKIEDQQTVQGAYKDMRQPELEKLMKGSLLAAYLMGKVKEDEQ